MRKTKHINFKISETDFRKITPLMRGKTMGQFFRELIQKAVKDERAEAESFLKLIEKLDRSDLSKIAEKLDMLLQKMNEPNRVKVSLTNLEILHEIQDKIDTIAAPKSDALISEIRQLETLSRQIIAHASSTNVMLENLLKK